MSHDPQFPTRDQLARIAGDDVRLLRALERLFHKAGDLTPTSVENQNINIGNALSKANLAINLLENLQQQLNLISTQPSKHMDLTTSVKALRRQRSSEVLLWLSI
jgi:hypothetical protein